MTTRFAVSRGCSAKREGVMAIGHFNLSNMFNELIGKKKEVEIVDKDSKVPQLKHFMPIFGSVEDIKCPSGTGGHDHKVRRYWNYFPPHKDFLNYLKKYFKED